MEWVIITVVVVLLFLIVLQEAFEYLEDDEPEDIWPEDDDEMGIGA